MSRIVETKFESFSIIPKYFLFFYFKSTDFAIVHAIDWSTNKKRNNLVGQWIIKYKQK